MEYDGLINVHDPLWRTGNFPLDAKSVFDSYAEALEYARGGSRDDNYTTAAYLGQVISVVSEGESGKTNVQVYKIVVETPVDPEDVDSKEIWGLALIGEGGGGGDGKVKDVQFNSTTFLNEETGIANFVSDEIEVKNGKLHIKKIVNEQTTIF